MSRAAYENDLKLKTHLKESETFSFMLQGHCYKTISTQPSQMDETQWISQKETANCPHLFFLLTDSSLPFTKRDSSPPLF